MEVISLDVIGKELVIIRKKKGVTQKKLCEGICSQSTISMIENGELIPGIDLITALALKLDTPISHFTNLLFLNEPYEKKELVLSLEKLMEMHKYDEIYKITLSEINVEQNNDWHKYYFLWLNLISGYNIKKVGLKETLDKIKVIYNKTSDFKLNKDYLNYRIINSIAIFHATEKEFKKSLFYFNKIDLNSLENIEVFNLNNFKLRVIFNKIKTLYDFGLYDEAIIEAKLGIEYSKKAANIAFLGNYYYYLGQCSEKKECEYSEIKGYYDKALLFFEFLNKEEYIKIIKDNKKNFLE